MRSALAEARKALSSTPAPVQQGEPGFVTSKQRDYEQLVNRLQQLVTDSLPRETTVVVVSKGDGQLLNLGGRQGWHFPRLEDGTYAGYYPADSAAAINHLEQLRAAGASYLVFPKTAFWWLEHYDAFRRHLETHYTVVIRDETTCLIFGLQGQRAKPARREAAAGAEVASRSSPPSPSESQLRVELARTLTSTGRSPEAHAVLLEGLKLEPGDPRLLIELAKREQKQGNQAAADRYAAEALARDPEDYFVNFELAKLAWQRGGLDAVEERLSRLIQLFPADGAALTELVKLYCTRIERGLPSRDRSLVSRFLYHLANPAAKRLLSAEVQLQVAESLGTVGEMEPALRSLEAALGRLNFGSDALQSFAQRLLRTIVPDKSAIPLHEKLMLAAFLTHAGNGFAAVQDDFKAQACYQLAVAAGGDSWNSASWAARFNLAFHNMTRGDALGALRLLSTASRIYHDQTALIMWPACQGLPWPHRPFGLAQAFERLRPAGSAWPRITVITPSFNQAAYVEETLLSILNQDYPELEYIVIDGQSTDGTAEILHRYESRLAKLIIEPDKGQTDALNKGLRLATGDIILWINSDDLLGPGALFMVALTWLEEKADIIAGFCCEHTQHRFGVINLPAVTQATFNLECLGDIFHYWLKGHYFYQPEVAFSRRIFEQVGGILDPLLYYTMDYQLWLRFAAAGARLSVVHWPIGFFRKHDKQKTADLDRTVIELASVRDRFTTPRPGFERRLQIKQRLQRAFDKPIPTVSVISTRAPRFFSADTHRHLSETFERKGLDVSFHDEIPHFKPGGFDLVILLVHLYREQEMLRKLRDTGHDGAVVGWFWDNHHHVFDNYAVLCDLDVCIAGHAFAASYLGSPRHIMAAPVPLGVTQWTNREAAQFFDEHGLKDRGDGLYGGFVRYDFAEKRNRLIEGLIRKSINGVYFLEESQLSAYFGMSPGQRFADWASHKVSICLPLDGDLSMRLFDALLTGQIPIVPHDVHDLDSVIPPPMQEKLPIVRFEEYTPSAVERAHSVALRAFDRQGQEGVRRRHTFVMKHHMFASRIRTILAALRRLSRRNAVAMSS